MKIVNKIDYNASLRKVEELIFAIEDYENEHYQFDIPNQVEAVLFRMEQLGLKQKDLVKYFDGNKSHVSEFLKGKRVLTKKQIRKLNVYLQIPYICLARELQDEEKNIKKQRDEEENIKKRRDNEIKNLEKRIKDLKKEEKLQMKLFKKNQKQIGG